MKNLRFKVLLLVLVLSVTATYVVSQWQPEAEPSEQRQTSVQSTMHEPTALAYKEPPQLIAGGQKLVDATNRLGFKLFNILNQNNRDGTNLIFSPASLTQLLLLAGNGSAGSSELAYRNTLNLGDSWSAYNKANRDWMEYIRQLDAELLVSSGMWIRSDLNLNPDFDPVLKSYDAVARPFHREISATVAEVNDWASSSTKGMITSILKEADFSPDTNLLLLNAVYFHGKWSDPFDVEQTSSSIFSTTNRTEVACEMMSQRSNFPYRKSANVQAVRLLYGADRAMSMVLLLPDPEADISTWISDLTAETYRELAPDWVTDNRLGTVELPKFKISSDHFLLSPLTSLGLAPAFSNADYSNMVTPGTNTTVESVVQKAVVEVDETGTKAAAVTGMALASGMMAETPVVPFHFRADRPFVFAIEDGHGIILFLGVINTTQES